MPIDPSYTFSVAPMMDCTDRHCRFMMRTISARAVLYTEMVTADAVRFGDRARLLDFHPAESPVILQLGGADPAAMAEAAAIGADWGYDGVNINVGCPSDRVQSGRFGACLMKEPDLVARLVDAIRARVDIPVSVKCRLGVDEQEGYAPLRHFVATVAAAGCDRFVVHARKAWLSGLSPKENREIPPLDYAAVHRLKGDFPALAIILNGGLADLRAGRAAAAGLDGMMLGRAVYQQPMLLADVDPELFGEPARAEDPAVVAARMAAYAEDWLAGGGRLGAVTRHMLGLFHGRPGARLWRRRLTVEAGRPGAGPAVVHRALAEVAAAAASIGSPVVTPNTA